MAFIFYRGSSERTQNKRIQKMEQPLLEKLNEINKKLKLFKVFKGKRKLFYALGFRKAVYDQRHFKRHSVPTIFDYAKNAIAINVPSYNSEMRELDEIRRVLSLWAKDRSKKVEDLIERKLWDQFRKQKKRCIQILKEGRCDLYMVYWYTTDYMGHLWRGDEMKMWETYASCDELVYDLKKFAKDAFVLVASDHGMKPVGRGGIHTDYAFYSSNIKLNLKNPLITDFAEIIKQKLRE